MTEYVSILSCISVEDGQEVEQSEEELSVEDLKEVEETVEDLLSMQNPDILKSAAFPLDPPTHLPLIFFCNNVDTFEFIFILYFCTFIF